jgi:hypothetical protein
MVLGRSGSGKSSSLRNFAEGEAGIFNVLGKRLPFRRSLQCAGPASCTYAGIKAALRRNGKRAYVIDDSTFLMTNANFDRAAEGGYGKYTEMAQDFQQLVLAAAATDEDTAVYFLHHPDRDELGNEKVQTVGKMLDRQWCVEGVFSVVLSCEVRDGEHVFVHENDGRNLAKAPMGMFPPGPLDNDLRAVDAAIREYWGMAPLTDEEEQ